MDLTDRLGFEANLNLQTGEISFGEQKPGRPQERTLRDMHHVLAQTNPHPLQGLEGKLSPENDSALVHWLYRYVGDTPEIEQSGLKLDITVINPTPFGAEFSKTTGHYHSPLPGGMPSPDFYQVVHGQGVILLQREDGHEISAFVVRPRHMQHVLIPPWMGHLTVNTGDEPLVFVNICYRGPHTNYDPYLRRHGGAYYILRQNSREVFVPNPAYGMVPPLQEMVPNGVPGLEDLSGKPFYPILKYNSSRLGFLTRPSEQLHIFEQCLADAPKK